MPAQTKKQYLVELSHKLSGKQTEEVETISFADLDIPKSIYMVQFKECHMTFVNGSINEWQTKGATKDIGGRLYPQGKILSCDDIASAFGQNSNMHKFACAEKSTNVFVQTRSGQLIPFYRQRDQIIEQNAQGKWQAVDLTNLQRHKMR